MSYRIKFGRSLLRLGSFIQSLPVVIMRPDDLVKFSRQSYNNPQDVESWSDDNLIDAGLDEDEQKLLSHIPIKNGELLLLGLGGGREAIHLAKMGFEVTGVDFIPAMVEKAKEKAISRGVKIKGIVQEISKLNVPNETYDVIWISRSMYSCIPTRKRRVNMVRRISNALKTGGVLICQYHCDSKTKESRKSYYFRRAIALFTLGNFAYEEGDRLWLNIEYVHAFVSDDDLRSELEEGNVNVLSIIHGVLPNRGGAVCVKDAHRHLLLFVKDNK